MPSSPRINADRVILSVFSYVLFHPLNLPKLRKKPGTSLPRTAFLLRGERPRPNAARTVPDKSGDMLRYGVVHRRRYGEKSGSGSAVILVPTIKLIAENVFGPGIFNPVNFKFFYGNPFFLTFFFTFFLSNEVKRQKQETGNKADLTKG